MNQSELTNQIQDLLMDHFCTPFEGCMACENRDVCFCTEAGILVAELIWDQYGNDTST
jgi:hypothetical protein